MRQPLLMCVVAAAVWSWPLVLRAQTALQRVEASTGTTDPAAWVVPGNGDPHAAVFRLTEPLSAKRVRVALAFDDGACFGEFALFATTDSQPALKSQWQPMFPVKFSSAKGKMMRKGKHAQFVGDASPSLTVEANVPSDDITGLKLEAHSTSHPGQAVTLKRLTLAKVNMTTSNIALGCPVTVSHPTPEDMPAEFLTDGDLESFARPPAGDLGADFHFDIDLKRHRVLDHLLFRLRPDTEDASRFTHIKVELFDEPPTARAAPVWIALHRTGEPQTEPEVEPGEMADVLKAGNGEGVFEGRYLRISSDSPVAFSPQLAEVEVYETLVPAGASMQAGDSKLQEGGSFVIPAHVPWLTFSLQRPAQEDGASLPMHWRIAGFQSKWIAVTSSREAECRAPSPGDYEFQAQVRHSDGVWDSARLTIPMTVPVPFWERRGVLAGATVVSALLAACLAWFLSRRIMSRRVAELERRNELANERTRIARDMHDAVGSQLTQLAVLHEIVAEELGLDEDARSRLRQLTDTARSSVTALDAVVWAVNPGNDNLAQMADYLCHVAGEYLLPLGIACRQNVPNDWPERHVASQTRHAFHLAFQEALQNVVKHAKATEVVLTMRFNDDKFAATIADNGIGLPNDLGGIEKNGLDNMQARLSALGGHCRVHSLPEGGTIAELEIPIPP